jgi:hypothetical protein
LEDDLAAGNWQQATGNRQLRSTDSERWEREGGRQGDRAGEVPSLLFCCFAVLLFCCFAVSGVFRAAGRSVVGESRTCVCTYVSQAKETEKKKEKQKKEKKERCEKRSLNEGTNRPTDEQTRRRSSRERKREE